MLCCVMCHAGPCRAVLQVLQDLVRVIRPAVPLPGWTGFKFLLRLDGKQQQKRVPAECTLATGESSRISESLQCNGICSRPSKESRFSQLILGRAHSEAACITATRNGYQLVWIGSVWGTAGMIPGPDQLCCL